MADLQNQFRIMGITTKCIEDIISLDAGKEFKTYSNMEKSRSKTGK